MVVTWDDFDKHRKLVPVVDVRSEGEFEAGHMRAAANIPLLSNAERAEVGSVYKKQGQLEAIKTGFRVVGPRLSAMMEHALLTAPTKELLIYCWRGGMRSSNFSRFAEMVGIKSNVLDGGYKTYRQEALKKFAAPWQLIVLGGCTGTGKTEILSALREAGEQVIDLEKLASHKGSVFGGLLLPPQPTTEQFQNELFEELLLLDESRTVWIEDESVAIGHVFLPEPFWRTLNTMPLIELSMPQPVRIERLVREYGSINPEEFLMSMEKIVKKLGGQHFAEAKKRLLAGDMHGVIEILLTYYDKAYGNGLERKRSRLMAQLEWSGADRETLINRLIHISKQQPVMT